MKVTEMQEIDGKLVAVGEVELSPEDSAELEKRAAEIKAGEYTEYKSADELVANLCSDKSEHAAQDEREKRRAGLDELARMTEDFGGYERQDFDLDNPITPEEQAYLDEAQETYRQNPAQGSSWVEVRHRLRKQYREQRKNK